MFGRKHLCARCQPQPTEKEVSTAKFPPGAVEKMRRMRGLGASWKVIAVPFDCNWCEARNFFLSNCGNPKRKRYQLSELLRIAEEVSA